MGKALGSFGMCDQHHYSAVYEALINARLNTKCLIPWKPHCCTHEEPEAQRGRSVAQDHIAGKRQSQNPNEVCLSTRSVCPQSPEQCPAQSRCSVEMCLAEINITLGEVLSKPGLPFSGGHVFTCAGPRETQGGGESCVTQRLQILFLW